MSTTRSTPATGGAQPPNPKRQKVTNAEVIVAAHVGVAGEAAGSVSLNPTPFKQPDRGAMPPMTDILGNAIGLSNSAAPSATSPQTAQEIGRNVAVTEQVGQLSSDISPAISTSAASSELQELLDKQKAEVDNLVALQATLAAAATPVPVRVTLPDAMISAATTLVGNEEGDAKLPPVVSPHDQTTDLLSVAADQAVATAASIPKKMVEELLAMAKAGVPTEANSPLSRMLGHLQAMRSAEITKASQPQVIPETPKVVGAGTATAETTKMAADPVDPADPATPAPSVTALDQVRVRNPTHQETPIETSSSLSVAASADPEVDATSALRAENQRLREMVQDHEYEKDAQTGDALMSVLRYCNKPNIDTINAVAARRSARARGEETEKDVEDMRILITSAAQHVALQTEVKKHAAQTATNSALSLQTDTVRRLQAMQRDMEDGLRSQQSELQRVACSGHIETLEQERTRENDPTNHKKATVARIDPKGPHEPVFATPQAIADIAMQQKSTPLFGERQSDQQVTVRDASAAPAAAAANAYLRTQTTYPSLAAAAAKSVANEAAVSTPTITPIDTLSSIINLGNAPSNFQVAASSQPTKLDNVLSNILGPVSQQDMRHSMRSSMARFMR
jgi:hypothetical protein